MVLGFQPIEGEGDTCLITLIHTLTLRSISQPSAIASKKKHMIVTRNVNDAKRFIGMYPKCL